MSDNQNVYSYTNSKGIVYYLHAKEVTLKNGRKQTIYYFAKDIREGALSELPEGKEVFETERTKMPVLRNKK